MPANIWMSSKGIWRWRRASSRRIWISGSAEESTDRLSFRCPSSLSSSSFRISVTRVFQRRGRERWRDESWRYSQHIVHVQERTARIATYESTESVWLLRISGSSMTSATKSGSFCWREDLSEFHCSGDAAVHKSACSGKGRRTSAYDTEGLTSSAVEVLAS